MPKFEMYNTKSMNNNNNFTEYDSIDFISKINRDRKIKDAIVTDNISFEKFKRNSCVIENCCFKGNVKINTVYLGKQLVSFIFTNCIFEKEINFKEGYFSDIKIANIKGESINFIGGNFFGEVSVSWDKLKKITVNGGEFNRGLVLEKNFKKEIFPLKHLCFNIENEIKEGNFVIKTVNIENIEFEGTGDFNNSSVYIYNVHFKKLIFNSIVENGRFKIQETEPIEQTAYLEINYAKLNNFEFINTDLRPIKIKIVDSDLTKLKTVNSIWGKEILSSDEKNYLGKRENYRQLKLAMLNQGDKIQALEFEKEELNAHYKSLTWKNDFWNKLILATNWTNNQGQSWIRPFLLLLGVSIFFYVGIKIFLGYKGINFSYLSYDIGRFFTFLNPTHSRDFLGENIKLNNVAYLLDSSYRFFSAYLLFQLIKAFRKYVINR